MKKLILAMFILKELTANTFNVSNTSELRKALAEAGKNEQNNQIILAEGRYSTTEDSKGAFKYSSNKNLVIIGVKEIILHGHNSTNIFEINSDSNVVFKKVVFIGENVDSEKPETTIEARGGGTLKLQNSRLQSCVIDSDNNVVIDNSYFNESYIVSSLKTTVKNTKFYNSPYSVIQAKKSVEVSNSIFANNYSAYGGAIHGFENTNVKVSGSTFTNNYGGAISGYTIEVSNSKFTKNSAPQGGAIWGLYLDIENSTFTSNSSACGGAISGKPHAVIQIKDSAFLNNYSTKGDVICNYKGVIVTLNSTLSNNSAEDGPNIYLEN
jgi:hypothetical protein